ncbi:guanylate kinase-associated protein mars [Eupeodes corollae]|uniref:guanylate kinase-associated protein mars n=1 Tax=Eupeodes corollae TaxID=290404 RepID=UPI00248FCF7C|nr:guanylate kinase-associated protein mars [Eupeodes corollae]
MDNFRSLYKANPTSAKKCKRKEAHEIRANKRSMLYTSTRNISPSPSPSRGSYSGSPKKDEKENIQPITSVLSEKPEPGTSQCINNEKLNRRKAHLLKFLAWKAEKAKKAEIKEKSKRAPFIVSTRNCAVTAAATHNIKKASFAPENHIFRPPATLQKPELKVIDSKSVRLINGTREETYHFLATPNKKAEKLESEGPTVFKSYNKQITHKTPVGNTRVTNTKLNFKPIMQKEIHVDELHPKGKSSSVLLKPKPLLPAIKRSNFKPPKSSNSSISNALMAVSKQNIFKSEAPLSKLIGKSYLEGMIEDGKLSKQVHKTPRNANQGRPLHNVNTLAKIKSSSKEPRSDIIKSVLPVVKSTTHASINKSNQKPVITSNKLKTISDNALVQTTKVGKTPLKPKGLLDTQPNPNHGSTRTRSNAGPIKPKSVLPPIKRTTFKAPKKTNSSISNALVTVTKNSYLKERPAKVKLNGKAVPKTLGEASKPSDLIPETPTDANQGFEFLNVVTSTKIKSSLKKSSDDSLFVEMDQLVSPVDDSTKQPADGEKFNFLRYSVVKSDEKKPEDEPETKMTNEVNTTPDKAAIPQTPTTYLSPYVSVSRGKVGIKIEREKRNSVYMSVDKSINEDADTTAKARHTMATVHYYRKQLKDEISRLDGQCDEWQKYKEANAHDLEDTGSDMINVTIGQTKLLTTKKLKQFGDLIDRCENGAMGIKSLSKGDGAKPILTEDLEGFWSMVGLQIENVDKRFANLQRWKENNWKDPDEVPIKAANKNNKIKKVKKTKNGTSAGPNRDLQKILKNAQAAFLRKKTANNEIDEDVILTPSKSRQVLIRDRRSRSAAATVITIHTPKTRRKSFVFDQTTPTADSKVLPHINGFRKSMNLFKSAILNKIDKTSPVLNNCATPLPISRKSILKTPGSIRQRKSVIFNSPTLQFTVEDKIENENPSQRMSSGVHLREEEEERTYSLRNRNIKLRDPAEIIIPH